MAYPMKQLAVVDAVGSILCHDLTRIVPGESKGPLFRKGHVIRQEDIPALLQIGKEHLYVYEPDPALLHENDAAWRIARAAAGENLDFSDPCEGRINFLARCQGLLRVRVDGLRLINSFGEIALATLHSMQVVHASQPVGGTRIIPLLIERAAIERLEDALARSGGPVLDVLPLRPFRVGLVTTGSEIFHGRIDDAFGPILREKFRALGSDIVEQRLSSDDQELTSAAILDFAAQGLDMVVVTGGMSVDPDDRTPASIRKTGADVVSYGAPTFPGAMFLLAYLGTMPVLGLPGCVMYHKASIFDLIVPRLLAGLTVSSDDIALLGHGGFCAGCTPCRFPVCAFGKA